MRIFTRYVVKEIGSHSLLGLLVFTFVIFVRDIGKPLEIVVRHNLPLSNVLTLFLLPIPSILTLTIPMAVLMGTLIGLSRMSADSEVIAARACGMGIQKFVRPVMVFAVIGWALTLWMSVWFSPQAIRKTNRMETALKTSQIPYEIQPRIFIEQFQNLLLYLQDVTSSGSRWRGVFIADSTQRDSLKVTLAESGTLVNEVNSNRLTLHLFHGTTHQFDPAHPEQYSVVSFNETDLPIPLDQGVTAAAERHAPNTLSLKELVRMTGNPHTRQRALVELHYRFALPVASLVLALVGIPLGLSTQKGGKAVGVVLTILLVFIYYIVMAFGLSFARQGRLHPAIGLWIANWVFAIAGMVMLAQLRRFRRRVRFVQDWIIELGRRIERRRRRKALASPADPLVRPQPAGRAFLQILDTYVLRSWLVFFAILLVTFVGIYVIFDFFQLLGDMVRNHVSPGVTLNYYRYLLPYVVYQLLPLSILVATLVNFGLLTKTHELTAIRSTGVSLYRISVPIFTMAAVISVGMFFLGDTYLPETNQRQDALRNQIKGRPAQTYYRPDRQWIFGKRSRIYKYLFFDPDRNVFANFSAFELDSRTFRMKRRIFATRVFWENHIQGWIFENGWVRDLDDDRVESYMPFSVATFRELNEDPAYFKKEVVPSDQMSAEELWSYIKELRQSGFDVVRLLVQFHRKFAFPLIAMVVAVIAVPFSFTAGSKGALSGFALSIAIAIVFWSLSSIFETMGNLNQLPPLVAAWSPDVLFGLGGAYLLLRVRT